MENKSNGTKFNIDRKIFHSDIWFSSPWKLKIWIYLIGHANYKENNFMGIKLKRGQLIRSYRRIAKDCSYKIGYRVKRPAIDTIKRICEELTKELRISKRTVHGGTLFTVLNYGKLQAFSKHEPYSEPNSHRTATVQDKNNIIKNKNKKNIYSRIFDYWNEQKIIVHRQIDDKTIRRINGKLNAGYTEDEIKKAIKTYGVILHDDDFYWEYSWTLEDFLNKGFEKFKDREAAAKNYIKKEKEDMFRKEKTK